jgi:hypothetical protein
MVAVRGISTDDNPDLPTIMQVAFVKLVSLNGLIVIYALRA